MAYSESKNKLGNRGSIKGEKTFNTKSGTKPAAGTRDNYAGTTKGATTHKKKG